MHTREPRHGRRPPHRIHGALDPRALRRLPEGGARGGAAQHCTLTTAHPGQVVQAQDVPVRMWHLITGGHAVVYRDDTPIGLLGRGDSWSEHSLLNRVRSSIAVVALSPLTMLTLGRREIFEIPDGHPVLTGRLVARSACSADRLALPVLNAMGQCGRYRVDRRVSRGPLRLTPFPRDAGRWLASSAPEEIPLNAHPGRVVCPPSPHRGPAVDLLFSSSRSSP